MNEFCRWCHSFVNFKTRCEFKSYKTCDFYLLHAISSNNAGNNGINEFQWRNNENYKFLSYSTNWFDQGFDIQLNCCIAGTINDLMLFPRDVTMYTKFYTLANHKANIQANISHIFCTCKWHATSNVYVFSIVYEYFQTSFQTNTPAQFPHICNSQGNSSGLSSVKWGSTTIS